MVTVQTKKQTVLAALLNAWSPKADVNYAKPTGWYGLFSPEQKNVSERR